MGLVGKVDEGLKSVEEAALSVKDLQVEIENLATKVMPTFSGPKKYIFKRPMVIKYGPQFNMLMENMNALSKHSSKPLDIHMRINSDEEDGFLFNPRVEVKGTAIHITGTGAPNGGRGEATISVITTGDFDKRHKVVKDELRGIVIEDNRLYLSVFHWEVSNELFEILKSTFGPSSGGGGIESPTHY